jgi:sugar phosphate isomerase/epimerase
MWHEFSLAHLSALTLAPQEMVEVAAHCGYSYVGLRLLPVTPTEPKYPLCEDRRMLRETRACIAHCGVGVLDIELARLAPETDVDSFEPMLATGAELGARHVIAQTPDPDRARATGRFARLCELAHRYGLDVNLEFVTWTDTPDLEAAAEILAAANQPNAGILIDTLHFCRSRCSLEHLRSLPRSWFRFVQVCDAPAEAPKTKEELIHAARNERRLLGEGGLDVRSILACLPDDIPYSLEIPMSTLSRTLGPEVRAHMAILSARRYLEGSVARPSRREARFST